MHTIIVSDILSIWEVYGIYILTFYLEGFAIRVALYWGILPDQMHLVHLAIGPDCITSALLDWSDTAKYIQGSSRDKRLEGLFESDRTWCEQQNVTDRASRKLFTVQILKPEGWKFVEPSQKILNATSCRYMLFWFCGIAKLFAEMHGSNEDMRHACINHVFLFQCMVYATISR